MPFTVPPGGGFFFGWLERPQFPKERVGQPDQRANDSRCIEFVDGEILLLERGETAFERLASSAGCPVLEDYSQNALLD